MPLNMIPSPHVEMFLLNASCTGLAQRPLHPQLWFQTNILREVKHYHLLSIPERGEDAKKYHNI